MARSTYGALVHDDALYGLIGAGFCIVVARKWRSLAVRLEPGEWLLVIRGMWFFTQVTTFSLMDLFTESWHA